MMFSIIDTGWFQRALDTAGLGEQDRVHVVLMDGRIIRMTVRQVFKDAAEYESWRRLPAEERDTLPVTR